MIPRNNSVEIVVESRKLNFSFNSFSSETEQQQYTHPKTSSSALHSLLKSYYVWMRNFSVVACTIQSSEIKCSSRRWRSERYEFNYLPHHSHMCSLLLHLPSIRSSLSPSLEWVRMKAIQIIFIMLRILACVECVGNGKILES